MRYIRAPHLRAHADFNRQGIVIVDPTQGEPGQLVAPLYFLQMEDAQALADDLWRAGVRPTEGKVGDRTLEAQQENLKDLREIVGRLLPSALRSPEGHTF